MHLHHGRTIFIVTDQLAQCVRVNDTLNAVYFVMVKLNLSITVQKFPFKRINWENIAKESLVILQIIP